MSDSDIDDGDPAAAGPSRRSVRASTLKQRAVVRPVIKKRTGKTVAAADAIALVVGAKDRELEAKTQESQFLEEQLAIAEREKNAAQQAASENGRQARNLEAELAVVRQQNEALTAERQDALRASCVAMSSAAQSYMDADNTLSAANDLADGAGQLLGEMEAVVQADRQRGGDGGAPRRQRSEFDDAYHRNQQTIRARNIATRVTLLEAYSNSSQAAETYATERLAVSKEQLRIVADLRRVDPKAQALKELRGGFDIIDYGSSDEDADYAEGLRRMANLNI